MRTSVAFTATVTGSFAFGLQVSDRKPAKQFDPFWTSRIDVQEADRSLLFRGIAQTFTMPALVSANMTDLNRLRVRGFSAPTMPSLFIFRQTVLPTDIFSTTLLLTLVRGFPSPSRSGAVVQCRFRQGHPLP